MLISKIKLGARPWPLESSLISIARFRSAEIAFLLRVAAAGLPHSQPPVADIMQSTYAEIAIGFGR